jgi:hypothetical protein
MTEILESSVELIRINESDFAKFQIGYPAALEFNNWNEMEVKPKDILPLIEFVRIQTGWEISKTDFRIFGTDFDLEFCHDGGFHFSFMKKSVLIEKLFGIADKMDLVHSVQKNIVVENESKKEKTEEYWKKKQENWTSIEFNECEK